MDLNPVDNYLHGSWEALGNAAPTLVALAQLCSQRWVQRPSDETSLEGLSEEATTILVTARHRGVIELRAMNSAFDSAARLLAVYVENEPDNRIVFRDKDRPEVTVRFLEGFRQLCERGLIIHHLYGEFSLAPHGIDLARTVQSGYAEALLAKASPFSAGD